MTLPMVALKLNDKKVVTAKTSEPIEVVINQWKVAMDLG